MLIINHNKKDYYDGVTQTMGIDKTIVYDRILQEIEDKNLIPKEFVSKGWNDKNPIVQISDFSMLKGSKYHNHSTFIVGFCGKLYIGWKLFYKERRRLDNNVETFFHTLYDFDYVKEHVSTTKWHEDLIQNVKRVNQYDAIEIFRKYNTPIFLYDKNPQNNDNTSYHYVRKPKFYINPILNDYEFYKVVDSFSAFQEIQMFLSGVLGKGEDENKNIIVDDKIKIQQHGFDKFSFRKDKENK